jgi:Family of unknown function (DUF6364)
MAKLTLSVDDNVVSGAKKYAKQHGVSISRMVERYLASVLDPARPTATPPILRSLRGSLKHAKPADYRKHLVDKYL